MTWTDGPPRPVQMKKRAQVPNLATFTIIFSGCAKSLHPSKAVTEATRIYNRMLQEESGYRLNTIHMNAVLSVCARAGDMTALFETLATANGRDRVPDSATYSTVFNGLRHRAERDSEGSGGLVDAHAQRKIEDRIEAAMKIWADARKEWKRGALVLDEAAVSALCRLLTTGGYRENDTVLEVLEEFMRVPRLDRPNMSVPTTPPPITTPPPLPARGTLRRPTKEIHYPAPSVKTLSTVLTALANTRKTGCAPKYWTYFTKILGLVPDTDNHICLLRAYEVGHASARAADLIETMPKHLLAPSTFRRAMVVCKKDNLYQDAFQHARRILAVMCATQRLPDEIAMRLFLQVARGNTAQFFEGAEGRKGKREAEEKQQASPAPAPGDGSSPVPTPGQQAYARQLATAIDDLWDPFHRLASSLSYPEGPTKSPAEQLAAQEDVMAQLTGSARRMMTVLDRAVEYTLPTDTDTLRQLRSRRAVLQRQVERWITKLYPQGEPPMSKALGEKSEARVDERRENRKRQLQWERSVARRPVSSSV